MRWWNDMTGDYGHLGEKFEALVDMACHVAGCDRWKAEMAVASYLAREMRVRCAELTGREMPPGMRRNDFNKILYEEVPFTSDVLVEEVEEEWKKANSRWWTAARVIEGRRSQV